MTLELSFGMLGEQIAEEYSMGVLATLITTIFLFPSLAYAYVDPGLVASLFQVLYIAVSGIFVFMFVNPIQRIKQFLKRFSKE